MSDTDQSDRIVTIRIRELGGPVPSGAALRLSVLVDGPADAGSTMAGQVTIERWNGHSVDISVACHRGTPPEKDLVVFAHLGSSADINHGDWLTSVAYPVHDNQTEIVLDHLI